MRWRQDYYLFIIGAVAFTAATIGYQHRRRHRPGDTGHIVGMGIGYTAMLTAFYVDNGPHLPLWDRLPTLAFWLLPSAIGAPLIARAVMRARRLRPAGTRQGAIDSADLRRRGSSVPGACRLLCGCLSRQLLTAEQGSARAASAAGSAGHEPVVDPGAAPFGSRRVPASRSTFRWWLIGGLGQVERRGQVADAGLAALMRADQGHQPQPDRISQGLEHLRQPGRRALADRLTDQRRGARLDDDPQLGGGDERQRRTAQPASTCLYLDGHLSSLASWAACCIDVYR